MDGWEGGCMEGWMDGLIDGRTDGWIDAWMDAWMEGYFLAVSESKESIHSCLLMFRVRRGLNYRPLSPSHCTLP